MNIEKGIFRIGHVFGVMLGVFLAIIGGLLFADYALTWKSVSFDITGSFKSIFVACRSGLIVLGAFIIGCKLGYWLGYLPFWGLAMTINWIIQGFKDSDGNASSLT